MTAPEDQPAPPAENRFELVFEASGVVGQGTAATPPESEGTAGESTGDPE